MAQDGELMKAEILDAFLERYELTSGGLWAPLVSKMLSSTSETEVLQMLGAAPGMRQWVGGRKAKEIGLLPVTVKNQPYESTIEIREIDWQNDKTGQLRGLVAEMGGLASEQPHELISDLVTANGVGPDGQNFFDTDHFWGDSGTQTNKLTATEIPAADVTTPTAPTDDKMALIINQAIGYMRGWKNDKGNYVNGTAREFVVMSGTSSLNGAVQGAVRNRLVTGSVDNVLFTGDEKIIPVLNPRISAKTTQIYIFRIDGVSKPFLHLMFKPPTTDFLDAGSDLTFNTDKYAFGVKSYQVATYLDWQQAVEVTLS